MKSILTFLCFSFLLCTQAQTVPHGVYVLPVKGEIGKGMLCVLRRAFKEIDDMNPEAVVIELDTPGGALDYTKEIITRIRAIKANGCPVYAFVNPDALSAGAMICLSTDAIFMASNATIGSAMPIMVGPNGTIMHMPDKVEEKILSAVRAMVRSLAQENGYREDVAIAMVDPEHPDLTAGNVVICPKGQLLNFTAVDATKIHPGESTSMLAKKIVADIPQICKTQNISSASIVHFKKLPSDNFALWITSIGPLIMGLAILALSIEFRTPGFGVFGISGIVLLAIYFLGHHVAGLAGLPELVLVISGLILLAIEIFIIPGFGYIGISGILCIVAGCAMAVIPALPDAPKMPGLKISFWETYATPAILNLGLTAIVVAVGAVIAAKFLPKTTAYNALVLQSGLNVDNGYVSVDINARRALLGQTGTAYTVLRPSGTAVINGKRLDVISNGDLIPKGTTITVISVDGNSIVVEECREMKSV